MFHVFIQKEQRVINILHINNPWRAQRSKETRNLIVSSSFNKHSRENIDYKVLTKIDNAGSPYLANTTAGFKTITVGAIKSHTNRSLM
jgi:hypothetical protein